jgi:hypothetical protein
VIRDIETDRTADTLFIEIVTTTVNEVSVPARDREAGRFPELGRAFYERGPGRTIAALAVVFESLRRVGPLAADGVAAFLAAYGPR